MAGEAGVGRLLVVEDEPALLKLLVRELRADGREVLGAATGAAARQMLAESRPEVVLLDLGLPDENGLAVLEEAIRLDPACRIIVLTGRSDQHTVVEALKRGAMDYLVKPAKLADLAGMADKAFLEARRRRQAGGPTPGASAGDAESRGPILGRSPAMLAVFQMIGRLAPSEVPVLVTGETGTGKELVARSLHAYGLRPDGPFVAVNCAAIPRDLLESELFGHVKGAFSGAVADRKGKFEEASGGTLFFDEIGELDPGLQAKLLRAVQEREIEPVGSSKARQVGVRIVAATNADLGGAVEARQFRADLYHRLAGAEIALPPLRERTGDVTLLAEAFLAGGAGITPEALAILAAHSWPGNVRELKLALERAVALARGAPIAREHLPERLAGAADAWATADPLRVAAKPDLRALEDVKRWYARRAVELCGDNKSEAARILGIDRGTLADLLKET